MRYVGSCNIVPLWVRVVTIYYRYGEVEKGGMGAMMETVGVEGMSEWEGMGG